VRSGQEASTDHEIGEISDVIANEAQQFRSRTLWPEDCEASFQPGNGSNWEAAQMANGPWDVAGQAPPSDATSLVQFASRGSNIDAERTAQ
jgi:hypothetical protein